MTYDDLPFDITHKIFSLMTLTERIKFEVVSTKWQNNIRGVNNQKCLVLTNKRVAVIKSSIRSHTCFKNNHCLSDSSAMLIVSSTKDITSILQRCPALISLKIDFEPQFVFSHSQFGKDLTEMCPLLEHLEWFLNKTRET